MTIATPMTGTCPFHDPRRLFEDLSEIRQEPELEYSEKLNAFVVSKYEDILQVLDNPDTFSSRITVPEPPDFILERFNGKIPTRGTLLGWDNPDHDRLRMSVSSFFVPRRLEKFRSIIQALANDLIDEFQSHGMADLKNRFALPLPLKVVSLIAGLDPAKWKWIGRSLALFGGHAAMSQGTLEDKIQGIISLHEYIAELIQLRKVDRRDDLISHIWDARDSGRVEMTDFEHLSMIPGLLLAGHETTTNLLSMGLAHFLERGLWDEVSANNDTRAAAIEELLRYESAITGMKREVKQPTKIGDTMLKEGDIVFAMYNSGSRDPNYFPEPDKIIIDRKSTTQHLGFGRGMHACLGAPLARLLLGIEFAVLKERLPTLRLQPDFNKQYDEIHEGRGIDKLLVYWDTTAKNTKPSSLPNGLSASLSQNSEQQTIDLKVKDASLIAKDVLQITFGSANDKPLPIWTPGAHLDLPVGTVGTRQYSLCSDPADNRSWQVAVLREPGGKGGSQFVHSGFKPGMKLKIGRPRNHFKLKSAKQYLFVAGGVGITPIRAMMQAARAAGANYTLIYLGSSRSRMAYANELGADSNVTIWAKDEMGGFDLSYLKSQFFNSETAEAPAGRLIYACGPHRLLSSLEELFKELPSGILNVEHFQGLDEKTLRPNKAFDVVLQRSKRVLHVPKDRSILDILHENGSQVLSTCARGTCGTCEVSVVEGDIEHRDTVLTKAEQDSGKSMMVCVSRCLGERLVLDLW